MNTLFITRAQPGLTEGHLDALRQGIATGIQDIIIGVGSADQELTYKNPCTYAERQHMIELCRKHIEEMGGNIVRIFPIPDFNNDEIWKKYILDSIQFDNIITGNPRVERIFKSEGKNVIVPTITKIVKASNIRRYIGLGEYDKIKGMLSDEIIEYLRSIKLDERIRQIMPSSETPISSMSLDDIATYLKEKNLDKEMKTILQGREPITPKIAADIVTLYNGKLVLIERRDAPYGCALPGGMMDIGERIDHTPIREAKEEISVDVEIIKKGSVYDSPTRDPRGHTVSFTYLCKIIKGELKASDDAKKIILVEPTKEEIEKINFAFPDHKDIIFELLDIK